MAKFLAIFALLTTVCAYASTNDIRFYVVPDATLRSMNERIRPNVIEAMNGLDLVKMDVFQTQMMAARVHAMTGGCGGFVDAQVLMEKHGADANTALRYYASRAAGTVKFDKFAPSYPAQVQKVLAQLNANRYADFLKEFSGFPDRYSGGDLGVKASQWLANRAAALAQAKGRNDVKIVSIPTGGRYVQPSVLVKISGADPSLPGVLVGGHMDTFPDNKPGADDDGTGSATVMETYNAVIESGVKFKRDVYFAFYAAEEMGLVGSQAVVAEFVKHKIPMRAIMQFDMTGWKSKADDKEIYVIGDHVDVNLSAFMKQLTVTYAGIPANMIGDTKCGYSCSDHASWSNAGYASAFPFEASFGNDNKTIHTSKDTMNLLTPVHAMNFVKIAAAFVTESADPNN